MLPPKQSFQQRMASRNSSQGGGTQNKMQQNNGVSQQQMAGSQPVQQNPMLQTQLNNPDVPMGDPIDTIAQMLGLDMTNMSSPEQQGQFVVQAVETLVTKLHELSGQPDETGVEQQLDDNTDPDVESEFEEGSPEYQEDDNSDQGDETESNDSQQQNSPPPKAAKSNPFAKKKGVAASFGDSLQISPKIVKVAADGRKLKIQHLVSEGYISPYAAKLMLSQYCDSESLALSLSDEDSSDGFDEACNLLLANGKVIQFNEITPGQHSGLLLGGHEVDLTPEALQDPKVNPMIADAERRVEAELDRKRNLAKSRN